MTADKRVDVRDWHRQAFAELEKLGIRQIGVVPDAGHSALMSLCQADGQMAIVPLTTEEEGIGLAAGAWFGGQRCALVMQSSGVGNCINMLSLPLNYNLPLLMLVAMRGEWGEFNPMQVHAGRATPKILAEMGVIVERVDRDDEVAPAIAAMGGMCFNASRPVAILFGQRLIGAKNFREGAK